MKKLVFKIATGIVLLSTALLLGTTGAKAAPPLPVEQLTGGHSVKVAPDQRIYVMDSVFLHLIDSRLNIYDRNTGKFLGMIPTAFNDRLCSLRTASRSTSPPRISSASLGASVQM
jgi:aralkylamine dehydrogenase heavy chain/methylamine dehydrogenase heavy chain